MSAEIKGLDSLNKKLKAIASDKAIMKGIAIACTNVESSAKQLAPVDTGLLKSSITHELQSKDLKGVIGTNCEYGANVEFGTISQRPQAFLEPAFIANKDKIVASISDSIKQELRRLSK